MADSRVRVLVSVLLTLAAFIVTLKEGFSTSSSELWTPIISLNNFDCAYSEKGISAAQNVGLAKCVPRLLSKQWIFTEGSFQWASDRKLCLVANCKFQTVLVRDCTSKIGKWEKSENFSLHNSLCKKLVLSLKGKSLGLAPPGRYEYQSWILLNDVEASLLKGRPAKYPERNKGYLFRHEMMRSIANSYTPLSKCFPYLRDVASFPGVVHSRIPRISRTVTLKKSWEGQSKVIHTAPQWWQETNLYAPPRGHIKVVLSESAKIEDLILLIGAQTDILTDESPNTADTFRRMPMASEEFILLPGVNKLRSQYGGSIIFKFLGKQNFSINVKVSHVVEAPFFLMGSTSVNKWNSIKQTTVPQSVLVSTKCVLVVPTVRARNLKNPITLLKAYDEVIELANNLSNFGKNDPPPPGRFWFVNDIQIPMGHSHPGFPIVFDDNLDLVNKHAPKNWNIWREVGENYKYFCWAPCKYNATGNLFALFMHETFTKKLRVDKALKDKTYAKLKKGYTFDNITDEERLVFFSEIRNLSKPKGWHLFQHLHKNLRKVPQFLTKNLDEQRDYAYYILSYKLSKDLYGFFTKWKIKISSKMRKTLKQQFKRDKELRERKKKRSSGSQFSLNLFVFIFYFVYIIVFA